MSVVYAWHFCVDQDGLAVTGEGRLPVAAGEIMEVEPPLRLCGHGLHGSRKLIDALGYAQGEWLCLTMHEGEIVEGDDKLCSSRRTPLFILDATRLLHEWACDEAEAALKLTKEEDPRPWNAIHTKRRWLKGEATSEELESARESARESAWASARASAWASARASARESAWASAWESARASAWESARASARASAWADQNRRLTSRVLAGLPDGFSPDAIAFVRQSAGMEEVAAPDVPEPWRCKVCGNSPDDAGYVEHGRGCHVLDPDGGGIEWIRPEDR